MIVYCAKNLVNRKIYVGITKQHIAVRFRAHIAVAQTPFQLALHKYGILAFKISIIGHARTRKSLIAKERFWIAKLDCKVPKGYNLTDGGDGMVNPTNTVRRKMSASRKGKLHTLRTRQAMSLCHGGFATGIPLVMTWGMKLLLRMALVNGSMRYAHSAATRKKIQATAKSKNFYSHLENSGECHRWKKGQKAWNKGKKCSAEWVRNLSESHKGYKMPLEQRLKIGAAHKGHRNYNPNQPRDLITGRLVSRTIQ